MRLVGIDCWARLESGAGYILEMGRHCTALAALLCGAFDGTSRVDWHDMVMLTMADDPAVNTIKT